MAIKFLKGVRGIGTDSYPTTRPVGHKFPVGIVLSGTAADAANSATTANVGTFDVLIVAGGGAGGGDSGGGRSGTGGAGGLRLLSANTFTSLPAYKSPPSIDGDQQKLCIIIGAGGSPNLGDVGNRGGNSCFDILTTLGGGGGSSNIGSNGQPGGSGGSGGPGQAQGGPEGPPFIAAGTVGSGLAGQGCPGGQGSRARGGSYPGPAGSAAFNSSFTGTAVDYACGGVNGPPAPNVGGTPGPANSGIGGGSAPPGTGTTNGASGGSGIVAVRYRNPAAPTTPLMSGGTCTVCTGGCIIHVFNASGLLNTTAQFSIN